ncbi:MAG: isochorismatase family protein [Pseudomonadota bacterium]
MTTPCALLIIDMQNIFLRSLAHLIPKVQDLAESWPAEDIYWLQFRNHPGSLYEKHLDWSDGMLANDIELIDGKGQDQKIWHYGYAPPLDFIQELKQKYDTAYVCGVDTDACVYAAMMALWDNEIRPILLPDYSASSGGPHFHEVALSMIHRQFGMEATRKGTPEP